MKATEQYFPVALSIFFLDFSQQEVLENFANVYISSNCTDEHK